MSDSNRPPSAYKTLALPDELIRLKKLVSGWGIEPQSCNYRDVFSQHPKVRTYLKWTLTIDFSYAYVAINTTQTNN